MNIFDRYIDEVTQIIDSESTKTMTGNFAFNEKLTWPRSGKGKLILESETAFELGHPRTESLSFLLWTDSLNKINDGKITVIGPEIKEIQEKRAPFGKVVLIGCHGFNKDNAYEKYHEMDMIRFKLNLEGYMLRAMSQNLKEWARVSEKAMNAGLSLKTVGNELIREYKKLEYVDAAEIIFITSGIEDIRKLKPIGEKSLKVIQAMNKIFEKLEFDCANCDFRDVCNEIEGLKKMHKGALKMS